MKFQRHFVITVFFLTTLACRPVFAIGWSEIFMFVGIILLFFGPPLWRFLRTYNKVRKGGKKK